MSFLIRASLAILSVIFHISVQLGIYDCFVSIVFLSKLLFTRYHTNVLFKNIGQYRTYRCNVR